MLTFQITWQKAKQILITWNYNEGLNQQSFIAHALRADHDQLSISRSRLSQLNTGRHTGEVRIRLTCEILITDNINAP